MLSKGRLPRKRQSLATGVLRDRQCAAKVLEMDLTASKEQHHYLTARGNYITVLFSQQHYIQEHLIVIHLRSWQDG